MSFRRFRRRLTGLLPANGAAWVVLRTVDSTNSFARRVVVSCRDGDQPPPEAVFVAYQQSRGRGRGRHVWHSPAGAGVYASLLLPAVPRGHLGSLPLLAAVGLARAVQPLVRRRVVLRWPNDLLVGERKLGGVLIESLGAGAGEGELAAIVGFGVNHRADPPLAGATSIRREAAAADAGDAGREAEELAAVTVGLVAGVRAELRRLGDDAYAARRYAAVSAHRDGERLRCRTPEGTIEGRFRGFDRRGFLRLETADGERSLAAGELIATGDGR